MPRRSLRILAGVAATIGVLLVALVVYVQSLPESQIDTAPDEQKGFQVNPDGPFIITLEISDPATGERRGLTIKPKDPSTVRERLAGGEERAKSFVLPPEEVRRVLEAIDARGLMNLHGKYTRKGATGPRANLMIRQVDRVRRVECVGHIPDELKAFADDLNAIVAPHLAGWK